MPDAELEKNVDAIVYAITLRRQLEFVYKGQWRKVMPMIFGRSKDGQWRLRAIQIGGYSKSGTAGDGRPRVFNLVDISQATVGETRFKVPRQFAPDEEDLITEQMVILEFDPKNSSASGTDSAVGEVGESIPDR